MLVGLILEAGKMRSPGSICSMTWPFWLTVKCVWIVSTPFSRHIGDALDR